MELPLTQAWADHYVIVKVTCQDELDSIYCRLQNGPPVRDTYRADPELDFGWGLFLLLSCEKLLSTTICYRNYCRLGAMPPGHIRRERGATGQKVPFKTGFFCR